jgi:hypothetical protein
VITADTLIPYRRLSALLPGTIPRLASGTKNPAIRSD